MYILFGHQYLEAIGYFHNFQKLDPMGSEGIVYARLVMHIDGSSSSTSIGKERARGSLLSIIQRVQQLFAVVRGVMNSNDRTWNVHHVGLCRTLGLRQREHSQTVATSLRAGS